jgi:hypothetical protein
MERTGPVDLQAIRERNVYDAGMEAGSTNARLDALDAKFDVLGKKISELSKSVDSRFEQVDKRLGKVDEDLKGMQRLLAQGAIAISGSMVLGFVTMVTVLVVKL